MADRYTYLPLIGPFVAVTWAGANLFRDGGARAAALARLATAAILVGLTLIARSQLAAWRDEHALFERALAVTEGNHFASNNLGNVLLREGRTAEAAARYAEAIRMRPDYATAHYNLANALRDLHRTREALQEYRETLRLDPSFVAARNNLGALLLSLGKPEEAAREYAEIIRRDPSHAGARLNLGIALEMLGRPAEARERYREALRLQPDLQAAARGLQRTGP
jgi:tetratricopeptide (TPR) repeat protein